MSKTKRKRYTGAYKAKVGLEALMGIRTVGQIAREYQVHPVQVTKCGAEMKIIAFIERRQTEVIRRRSSSYGGTGREDSTALRIVGRQTGPRTARTGGGGFHGLSGIDNRILG